ncbi:Uncharacterised protein [Vibrio cholerae]|nr:Uncharacterised protein [Vibrio cholerae]
MASFRAPSLARTTPYSTRTLPAVCSEKPPLEC